MRRIMVLLIGAVLVATACGVDVAAPSPRPTPPASATVGLKTPPPTGSPAAALKTAPDFTARLLDGGTFTLSQERGRAVLILFTASWCAPCIPEVNKMAQLQDEFGARGLRQLVLSIDPGDTVEDFDSLRRRTRGQRLLWGLDVEQRATRAYQIRAVDTKVIVDAQGRIVFGSIGSTEYETLRRAVAGALP